MATALVTRAKYLFEHQMLSDIDKSVLKSVSMLRIKDRSPVYQNMTI